MGADGIEAGLFGIARGYAPFARRCALAARHSRHAAVECGLPLCAGKVDVIGADRRAEILRHGGCCCNRGQSDGGDDESECAVPCHNVFLSNPGFGAVRLG